MSTASAAASAGRAQTVKTDIPARMDRLPWSKWHWLVIIALGITWILDGIEVTIVGNIAGVLTKHQTLGLSKSQVAFGGSMYILGAVIGALFFGYLTDRLGRKKLFMVTLGVYLVFTAATALSWGLGSYLAFRFLTGTGIGGEYAAINSAIDELIPGRVRGWVDLAINGSYWFGAIIGSVTTLFTLNALPVAWGWRVSFAIGVILAFSVLLVRHYVPESPRWLMTHGKLDQANEIVRGIEDRVKRDTGVQELPPPGRPITIQPRGSIGFLTVGKTIFGKYPKRTILGLSLFIGQAFLYNSIFFTYALVLGTFYKVPTGSVPFYLIAFAIGNFIGPLALGKLFDTIGRRTMISFTYIFSGVALGITGYLFERGTLSATTQTLAWVIIFFFASAGASSAYLTVSEVFPLELRSMAIAFFYAVGTGLGGFLGPVLFGALIQSGSRVNLFYGYLIGAVLMTAAGLVEVFLGINAERKSLESIAKPLSATGEGDETSKQHGATGGPHTNRQDRARQDGATPEAPAATTAMAASTAPAVQSDSSSDGRHPACASHNIARDFEVTSTSNVPMTISGDVWSGEDDTGEHTTIDLRIDLRGAEELLRNISVTLKPYQSPDAETQNLQNSDPMENTADQEVLR